ncbi:MAG: hypothetical protein ACHREM_03590 [Polyangiales bacterium]
MNRSDIQRDRLLRVTILALGLVVFFPAMLAPFVNDDWWHAAMVDGTYPVKRGPFDLYDFIRDGDHPAMRAAGFLPWWTSPALRVRFFRPLSSAALWSLQKVFGRAPLPMHCVSILWWTLAVVAAHALFRRLFSRRVAWLGTFVFALAPCHAVPILWLSNFEALASLATGTLGLVAFVRWRDDGRKIDLWLATIAFSIAMALGEYSLAAGGYVVALAWTGSGSRLRRALGTLPFFVPAIAYLALRFRLGYGTAGSGYYVDPLHQPLALITAIPFRAAVLVGDLLLSLRGDVAEAYGSKWTTALMTLGVLVPLSVVAYDTLERAEPTHARACRAMLAGAALSLVPLMSVRPAPRLLGVVMLGVAPTIALILDRAWSQASDGLEGGRSQLRRTVAIGLGFFHLVHAPATAWLIGYQNASRARELQEQASLLHARTGDAAYADVTVVRSSGTSELAMFAYDPAHGLPAHWNVLSSAGHILLVQRDDRTFDLLSARDRSVIADFEDNLYRANDDRIPIGAHTRVGDATLTVLEDSAIGPSHVRVRFDRPFGSLATSLVQERVSGFESVVPPGIGFGAPLDP